MDGDQDPDDPSPDEMTARLRRSLESCRSLVDDYREVLLASGGLAGSRPPSEPEQPTSRSEMA